MHALLPGPWTPRARLLAPPVRSVDDLYLRHALRCHDRAHRVKNAVTGWSQMLFANTSDYTAVASTASEASLLSGVNDQPVIPALYFDSNKAVGRAMSIWARGIMSNTGTPTLTFQVRSGTTAGSASLAGGSIGVSAAITTTSTVTNKWWELRLDLICRTPGIGTGNATLQGAGYVASPGGFASPFVYALEPTTPDTATWTQTLDASLTQYLNLSVTWSANSASNTITLKQLFVLGLD